MNSVDVLMFDYWVAVCSVYKQGIQSGMCAGGGVLGSFIHVYLSHFCRNPCQFTVKAAFGPTTHCHEELSVCHARDS